MGREPSQTWASPEAVEVWRRGLARRRQALAAATERLLDGAGLRCGSRVLDLAAGTGEQSLLAAERVGPSGLVLATDISASMLAAAEEAAREAGASQVRTRVMDAAAIDLESESFDAVISRLGLMFVSDLSLALRGALGVLRPGGRLAAIVWAGPERNPMMGLPDAIADRLGWPVAPRRVIRRALSLGNPTSLEAALSAAGFVEVLVEPVAAPRMFGSAAEAAGSSRTDSPVWRDLVASVPEAQAARFWREVEQAFTRFEGPTGCVLPGEVLVASGARPT